MTIVIIVGGSFLLLGLHLIWSNEKQKVLAGSAHFWPATMGRIAEARVYHAKPGKDEDDFVVFYYEYDVHGVHYVGGSYDMFGLERLIGEMAPIVLAYPNNAEIEVRYNPDDPAICVIDPDHRHAYFINRNFGIFLTCVGCLFLTPLFFARWN